MLKGILQIFKICSMKISSIQAEIKWHKVEENLQHFSNIISSIEETDIIVLPEMWSTGFTMKAHLYYSYASQAIDLMKKWSLEKSSLLIGSLIVKENGNFLNRLFLIKDGQLDNYYDKKHLFAYAGEDRFYANGAKRLIYEYKGWRINPQICYDLRFPVWCRNSDDYDLLIFSANWPNKRIDAWDTLLKARAIENQCYVVGVNCFGEDIWDNNYSGHSATISFDGSVLDELKDREGHFTVDISKQTLNDFRADLPFLKDRDNFKLDL